MLIPLGKEVNIFFFDSDHVGNRVSHCSHTVIMIYLNMTPIVWYSKRQNTVKTNIFSAELIALRIATDLIESLICKLIMMGIPLAEPARVMCDNQSVVVSRPFSEPTLKKKHCSVAHHRVREILAAGNILIYYESTASNIADLFTKVLTANKSFSLIQSILS